MAGKRGYVDREKLIDTLYEADAITMRGVKIINGFPSADVMEVRHAIWDKKLINKEHDSYTSFTPVWTCPVCGTEYDGAVGKTINFCYICGSKMEHTEKEEDK